MELEVLEGWKIPTWESRKTRCFCLYCGRPSAYYYKVRIGEKMEIRLVFCQEHYEQFKELVKKEVKA